MRELYLSELKLVSGAITTSSSSGSGVGVPPVIPNDPFTPSPYNPIPDNNPIPDGNDYCEDGGNY